MKKGILSLALLAGFTVSKAQGVLEKGKVQINAGLGFSSWGVPVYAGFDYAVSKNITIGAEGSYRSYSTVGYKFSVIGISGNANYHFNELFELPKKMDLYAGLNLGYYVYNTPNGYGGSSLSTLGISGQIGARYIFTDKVGGNLELGGGNAASGGKIGVTIKL
ncbi:MAG: hypothetical protein QM530_10310 [Phycisphaerales bacterium]|nr:hypothetical protein [Phycisphaerales bacterium]